MAYPSALQPHYNLSHSVHLLFAHWHTSDHQSSSHSLSGQILEYLFPFRICLLIAYASGLYVERSLLWCSRLVPPYNSTKLLPSSSQK
ncbi:hypothetical protein JR316_0009294 [Psilocybe cubensis]|uniref:Uncharacterized protein n=1 Tax=Psilocybe cubensis TaxID=181762 RepID=A0ACB8GTS5_PSICU|nr:hypothetical protein JR316_0009294 [Psilocybe cubensis]KAH9478832.1 hypothetical protein JR316_0009294 [Psilocybe cubensis]